MTKRNIKSSGLNTNDLHALFTDEKIALDFAKVHDMLYDNGECQSTYRCNGKYKIVIDASTKTGERLQCPVCRKTKSLFYNSIFTRSKIGVNIVLHLLYCWSQKYSCKSTAHECKVSINTVTNYFQAFRQACKFYIDRKRPFKIGGPGYNVEIDETVISKRKSYTGRVLKEVWVFGGICRETKERFALSVPNRKSVTLLPLIQKNIEDESIIHSDSWPAYDGIDSLPGDYTHLTVNHSKNFVDPKTGSHIQTIERMWRELKLIKHRYQGLIREDIDYYIAEYLWRTKEEVEHKNAFTKAIILVIECPYF